MQEVITRGNKIYSIPRTDDESRETYLKRVEYIIEKLNDISTNMSIEKVIQMSYIWRNSEIYGMVYPTSINNKIQIMKRNKI